MFNQRPIVTYHLFNSQTITKNTNASSVAVDLREIGQDGIFGVFYTITGDGVLTLEYTGCITDDGTFIEPSGASDIGSSLVKTSGTGGSDFVSFQPELMPFMKIKATETGTSANAVLDLYLLIQ